MTLPPDRPAAAWRPLSLAVLLACLAVLLAYLAGCALRTVPPIRFVPLVGAQKKVTTPAVLAQALRDPDIAVRAQAVKLLGVLADNPSSKVRREVAAALGTAARDRETSIRLMALERLGQMDERYANQHLRAALQDPSPLVRERVMSVLAARHERGAKEPPPTPTAADSAAAAP